MVLELSGEATETYRSVVSRLVESRSDELGLLSHPCLQTPLILTSKGQRHDSCISDIFVE